MAVTYSAAVKTARMQAVRDAINAGSGAGKLEIGTAGMALVLVTVPLTDPVTVAGAVLTLLAAPATVAAAAGAPSTAAAARIRDSDNTDIVTGLTVGTTGTDVVLDSTSITAGQDVTINTATVTHAT
jgi:hypothetical protein